MTDYNILRIGTTQTLEFELPCPAADLAVGYITIDQNRATVLEKTLADCTWHENILCTRLSQEDTLALDPLTMCEIQFRGRTALGDAIKSEIYKSSTDRILKDGVI